MGILQLTYPRLDISENEFKVEVTLDIPGEEDSEEPPTFFLHVKYPDDYPDVAPHLEIHAAPNAAPHPQFNTADDREQLLEGIVETVQENLGIAMIFTLYSALKEAAEQLVQDRKASADRVREEAALAAEREENKKFQGTPVTPETFLKWREDFLKEMEEIRIKEEEERLAELKKAKGPKEPVKLTGRQLWETGLAGKGDEGDEEEGDDLPEVEKLKVEA